MALFFFPGVGVVDDEVGQGELARGFRGGDQAVDGLRLPGERIGGCSTPRRGQCDLAVFVGVWAIEHGAPPLGWGVVVADEAWVVVGVDAFLPRHPWRRCDRVGRSVTPVPFVVRGGERDRDVASQQVDDVGLGRVGDVDDGGYVFIRVRHPDGKLVNSGVVCVNSGSSTAQNAQSRGRL